MATPAENTENGGEPQHENGTGLTPNAKDPELTEPPTSLVPQSNLQNGQPPREMAKAATNRSLKTKEQPQRIASYPNLRESLCPKATPQNGGPTETAKTKHLKIANQN